MIFVKMGENPSGITITKNQENVSLMFCICFTTCVSSKSGLGDKMFPSSNLEDQGSCIRKTSNKNELITNQKILFYRRQYADKR